MSRSTITLLAGRQRLDRCADDVERLAGEDRARRFRGARRERGILPSQGGQRACATTTPKRPSP